MAAESRNCGESVITDEGAAHVGPFAPDMATNGHLMPLPGGRILNNSLVSLRITVYQINPQWVRRLAEGGWYTARVGR